eukprot:gene13362-645_t
MTWPYIREIERYRKTCAIVGNGAFAAHQDVTSSNSRLSFHQEKCDAQHWLSRLGFPDPSVFHPRIFVHLTALYLRRAQQRNRLHQLWGGGDWWENFLREM